MGSSGGFITEEKLKNLCEDFPEETGVKVPHLDQFKVYSEPGGTRHQTIYCLYSDTPSGKLRLKQIPMCQV